MAYKYKPCPDCGRRMDVRSRSGYCRNCWGKHTNLDQQPKIDLARLGHKVRELRLGKGWTLADLARESGLSKAYISDVENGAAGKPNIQYIFVIARSVGVTLDELLHDATEKGVPRTKKVKTDLPPGLAELQEDLQLSDDDVERLATVNFRGHRPRDKEGWRFLLETLQMLSQRKLQK